MRPLAALLALTTLTTLSLAAQSSTEEHRIGLGLSAVAPTSNLAQEFGTGFQAGLQVYYYRDTGLGRLRFDYLQTNSKHAIRTGDSAVWNGTAYVAIPNFANSRMEAYSVHYEWMPALQGNREGGFFAILGMGGTLWNETLRPATSGYGGTYTETDLGFTVSAGLGWRFNPQAAIEVRFVNSDLIFHQHPNYGSNRSYLTLGASFRL